MAGLRLSDSLLEQVAAYTAEAVSTVTMEDLSAPTPCAQWNLLTLILHLNTSLGALIETFEDAGFTEGDRVAGTGTPGAGTLGLLDHDGGPGFGGEGEGFGGLDGFGGMDSLGGVDVPDDIGALLSTAVLYRTERLVRIRAAALQHGGPDLVLVGGRPLTCDTVAAIGAVEIAVHSWDIARACGRILPLPDAPAAELLELSSLIVDGAGRRGLFASAVTAPPQAGPGDRLIALLGRAPR
ncbi:hypothetical protein Caci_3649 [Catenulispora acidiphila DSM 44928]|uniref:Uncharacterized protein n=1 Tax=Catenulispora acidiphila (strain DSM 44928 / JCM 14897 / NBRC 102108 / NRRL B-24433 / ID139908) TaxID=479433 RepID=C7QBT2_CATAD|nr:maleylpyruvate isomerase N-terminal domain-containing protein [Catenulispora acidiphila]ACU72551.1 hypothetical protein Caci_3649 [Catenulispora acidiphila DSM 44928]